MHWRNSAQMYFWADFEFDSEHFQHPTCATFSAAKFSDDGNKCQFPIHTVVHILLVVKRLSSRISTPTLSLVSVVTAVASQPLQDLSPMTFPLLLKQQTQHIS